MKFGKTSLSLDFSRLSDKQLYNLLNGSASELKRRGIILTWVVNYDPNNPKARSVLNDD